MCFPPLLTWLNISGGITSYFAQFEEKSDKKDPDDHTYETVFHILFLDITIAIRNF